VPRIRYSSSFSPRFLSRFFTPHNLPRGIGRHCRGSANRALNHWHNTVAVGTGQFVVPGRGLSRRWAGYDVGSAVGAHGGRVGTERLVAGGRSLHAAAASARGGGRAGARFRVGVGGVCGRSEPSAA
jgi:hypothetical protein